MLGVNLDLGYANARVKGLESKLLTDRDYANLKNVKTIDSFVTLLQETGYKNELIEFPKHAGSISFVLDALKKNYDATLKKVESYTPKKYSKFLSYFDFDELCRDVKKIYSKFLLNEKTDLFDLYSQKSNKLVTNLLEAQNTQDFIRLLKHDERFKSLHDIKHYSKKPQEFYHDIDAIQARSKHSLKDFGEKVLTHLLEIELKFKKEILTLRLLKRKATSNQIIKELRKEDLFKPHDYVTARLSYESFKSRLQKDYNNSFTKISEFEEFVDQKFYDSVKRVTRVSVMNLSTLYSYLILKEIEVQKLRTLAVEKFGENI
ncbi:V-type ATP synthase subunit C [uncultured archaeon]|nr:V-type ATP synthase subunit C [uncultured archaeon]